MKKLTKNEWIGIAVSLLVIGFFFVFGQLLISIFVNPTQTAKMDNTPKISFQDIEVGVGPEAVSGSKVTVHYTGRFTDGKVFDSSVTRGTPFTFVLGTGSVILGWEQGITGMRVGGKRIMTIPPELGYGANGYGPIPANSTLIFEVQLLNVEK